MEFESDLSSEAPSCRQLQQPKPSPDVSLQGEKHSLYRPVRAVQMAICAQQLRLCSPITSSLRAVSWHRPGVLLGLQGAGSSRPKQGVTLNQHQQAGGWPWKHKSVQGLAVRANQGIPPQSAMTSCACCRGPYAWCTRQQPLHMKPRHAFLRPVSALTDGRAARHVT